MKSGRTWLGIALSALLLWWTMRGTDIAQVWQELKTSNIPLFILCALVATCIFPLRARRWRPILEPVAGSIAFGSLWRSTAIGMMMNNVLPLRAGEFGRAFALTREVPRVTLPTALSSLGVDRIFDALVLFGLMFGAMLDPAFPSGASIAGQSVAQLARGGMAALLLLLVFCYIVVLQPGRMLVLVRAVSRAVLPRFEEPLARFFMHAVGGLGVLRDTRRFLSVLFWALAHWLVHALGLYLGFLAVGLDAPFSAALFLQGVLGIGVALPSSPGFVGVFEAAAVAGLAVYGVSRDLAFSWAVGYHVLSFIPITVIGILYFVRLGLSVAGVRGAQKAEGIS